MVPVLERLQKLEFTRCQLGKVFSKKLPLWSPELRELEFSFCTLSKKDGIRQRFPKLESIGFRLIWDVKNSDMAEFLHQNPQLKQIAIYHCTMLKTWTKKNGSEGFGLLPELKVLTLTLEEDVLVKKIGEDCWPTL